MVVPFPFKIANFPVQASLVEKITIRSKQATIYTIYGSIYTTFGLGVRHTGPTGRPRVSACQARLPGQAFRPAC
jgi:hypothetical protein